MKRLAFIRLIHQEAVDQSRRPEPMNKISVLAFHDAVEQFLILACEHRRAAQPSEFMKYWNEMKKVNISLVGKVGMDRLNRCRRDFKHAGTIPGNEQIEYARNDVASFFEENTPIVFGIPYSGIDMADLISQDEVRSMVKQAGEAQAAGNSIEAMILLGRAFGGLFNMLAEQGYPQSPFRFGGNIGSPLSGSNLRSALNGLPRGDRLADQLIKITDITQEMQTALQVMSIGIDYHRYHRFLQLTPRIEYTLGGRMTPMHGPGYAPTAEDFDYCQQFVIAAALRLGEIQAHVDVPAWAEYR
jgi:hypothetical protein